MNRTAFVTSAMLKFGRVLLFLALIFLVSCSAQNDPSTSAPPEFNVAPAKQGDSVAVTYENGAVVFDVQSVSGIGSAIIERGSGSLPETIIVRLHITGLEEFRLSYDETVIVASLPSGEGFGDVNERLLTSDGETPITARHPLWMDVRVISTQAAPKIPLEEGYFEISLPKDLGTSFEIAWVDFYR